MKPATDYNALPFPTPASEATLGADEARVLRAVEEYCAAIQAGKKPNRQEFLARHADIAGPLAKCLDGLEFVYSAASELGPSGAGHPAAEDVQPAGPLGDYQIVRAIGRGGMGVVYEAVQMSLGRRVALKVLPFAAAVDPRQLQRFKNEAQAAAHLHHPHIVPVIAVGCERGVHYYAMQFIDGQTLAALIDDLRRQRAADKETRRQGDKETKNAVNRTVAQSGNSFSSSPCLPVSLSEFFLKAAQLGIQAAEALEHAHQLGVIHRDIKPANLLVDGQGDLFVTDFGLARLGNDAGLTMTGDLLGTARYMSPEQALAKRRPLDGRTDVYSLGVTLYELLTLEPAYNGRNREEVLRQIAFEEPRPPRRLNPTVPAELETIVLKAMAKSPEERYATAQELADDLRRFLEDKPIQARRPALRQRALKWARRHKAVVRAAVMVLVLAVAALAVSTWLIWEANQGLDHALKRERLQAYFQRIALAEREWSANNLGQMQRLLEECPNDLRGWEWYYLKRLPFRTLPPLGHADAILDAAFSPDGRRIASASRDGIVKLWDAQTGQELFQFQASHAEVASVVFSTDSQRLATGGPDGTVKVWDAQTGQPLRTLKGHPGHSVRSVAFHSDGRRLASAGGQAGKIGEMKIWDTVSGQELHTLSGHTAIVHHVAFSPDGQRLASASGDRTAKIWDAETGREILTFREHTQPLSKIVFSPDGRWLASAAGEYNTMADGEVKIWDARAGREVRTLRGHVGPVFSVAFSPDGRRLASAGLDATVKLWDAMTGLEVLTLRGHLNFMIPTVTFSADGTRLLSASHDRTIRIWDATPVAGAVGEEILTLHGHHGGVRGVAVRPDGRVIASAGVDATVRIWDAQTGMELRTLSGHTGIAVPLAFSRQGRYLVQGGRGLTVWDATTWKEILFIPNARAAVACSPDEKWLASGCDDHAVTLWDMATGQDVRTLRAHNWGILSVAFSPDGRLLASASADSTVRLWDLTTGAEVKTPQIQHRGCVKSVAFSSDGRLLATANCDQTVKLWDTATWRERRSWHDPTAGVWSVTFHPDSRRLAWGGTDGTVKVGDADTGAILRTLRGHTSWVESVVFSPDGRWFASASLDGTIKLWQTPPLPAPPGPPAAASGQ